MRRAPGLQRRDGLTAEYGLEQGDVWFARRIDIARWWLDHHEEFER